MMSSRTTNARRRAVEREVKAAQLRRAAIDAHIAERKLAIKAGVVHEFPLPATIGEPVSL